ncbi:unnamed protein product [Dovyalis caffra]|uniref:Caffeic acid O-methyltransferase n=1 Tax=Dovyalis caffra TaxID=77055 RepID=A0AAV1S9W0_9ROSI|nr:unnamed protein product [Dovyalis caffra]
MSQQDQEEETGKLAIRLANAAVLPMVLKSAVELNIIDIIFTATSDGGGAVLSSSEIAARIPTKNPDASVLLDRMLRLLASYDILKCLTCTKENGEIERAYSAGPICKFLVKSEGGSGGSVAPLFLLHHDEVFMKSWGIPFNRAYGMTAFEYPGTDQRFNSVFNQAMSSHTTLIMKKILDIYKGFDGLKVCVDVGGGTGVTLNIITSKYPHIKGINYDLSHVLADAPSYPALPSNGKVIIVESLLPVSPENVASSHIVFEQDLLMLAQNPGGKERTQKEFEVLAKKSGFSGCEVMCCAYNSWVMEFEKRALP